MADIFDQLAGSQQPQQNLPVAATSPATITQPSPPQQGGGDSFSAFASDHCRAYLNERR